VHRQRPGSGRPRKAAAATQGFRPEEAATLPPPVAAEPRKREPLTARVLRRICCLVSRGLRPERGGGRPGWRAEGVPLKP
jgi:hypothetical protein